MSLQASFAVSWGAHVGIGTLPILFFGTLEQKQKYLPKLATGEMIAAFSLSEANCGSDPLSARTKATLSPDGKYYLLNGEKMWTTNAGWADLFIVFAKVDGEKFTAFIVERTFPGVSVGREEHKLGIKGSSTRRVILDNAQVPVENVLHEIGKGHHVAFGVLNIGRFKLAAAALGGAKEALTIATRYAKDRHQFGQPIANFGMIKHKLAEMAIQLYALESTVYRTAGMLEEVFHGIDPLAPDANAQYREADEEYPVECAILKVFGSEVLDYVADETMQIHGGFGYTEEFPAAQIYRDSRINRIFEGTNEINRLLMLDQLMRRALKGKLPGLMEAIGAIRAELNTPQMPTPDPVDPLDAIERYIANAKKAVLAVAGMAAEQVGTELEEKQEIVGHLADCLIQLYAMESAYLRTRKLQQRGYDITLPLAMTRVFAYDAMDAIEAHARRAIHSFAEGDMNMLQYGVGLFHTEVRIGQNMFPANVLLVEGIEETLDKYFLVPKPSVEERGAFNQHPAVKPLALCEYLIQLAAPAGAVVLDPFLGSGTTALAARNLKRRYIGIEINPEYVAIARQRLQNFTPSLFE